MAEFETEALELLGQLVEASRAVPRAQRGGFLLTEALGGSQIDHPGLPESLSDYDAIDLRSLESAGLLHPLWKNTDGMEFDLTNKAFDVHDAWAATGQG